MPFNITVIPGDGIGPEVIDATLKVLEATGVKFNWDVITNPASFQTPEGTSLANEILQVVRKNKVGLKGPTTTPPGPGFRSLNSAIRKGLDLYACLRPCKLYPGVNSPYKNVDVVVVRENTEDLHTGVEYQKGTPESIRLLEFVKETKDTVLKPDSGISFKVITESGSRRIADFAFSYARQNKRRRVIAVHKANVMKYSDGLFLEVARGVASNYPDIEFSDAIVDNLCMQLVRNPQQFDVLVLPNLYGDIVSDLCAGLIGGIGLAPGANFGNGLAIFEPAHGSAPKYAGLNKVNPMATMLSGALMLNYLGATREAHRLETAILRVIAQGKNVTYDLKLDKTGGAGTSQVADAVIRELRD